VGFPERMLEESIPDTGISLALHYSGLSKEYVASGGTHLVMGVGIRHVSGFLVFGGAMSGGYFDYKQYQIEDIAQSVDKLIRRKVLESCTKDEEEQRYSNYSSETLQEFKTGARLLRQAAVYAQRIDWLVSGDNDEDGFHKRLKEDLDEIDVNLAVDAVEAENERLLFEFLYQTYKQGTRTMPECERENSKVLRAYAPIMSSVDIAAEVKAFLKTNPWVFEEVKAHAPIMPSVDIITEIKAFLKANPWVFEEVKVYAAEYQTQIKEYGYSSENTFSGFFNQPVVLLMYYLAAKMPDKVSNHWPLDSDRVLNAILMGLNNKKIQASSKKTSGRKPKQ